MQNIKAIIYQGHNKNLMPWTLAFAKGLLRHDIAVDIVSTFDTVINSADLHVFWGMGRHSKVIEYAYANKQPFICLDHGYTKDRDLFSSINLNNLNAKSELVVDSFVDSARCFKYNWFIEPTRIPGNKHIIIGQIWDDKSLEGNDVYAWAIKKVLHLLSEGINIKNICFKPHPHEKPIANLRYFEVPCETFWGSMEDACEIANTIYTFSSTAGAHAWINGVQAVAHSPMSVIYNYQFKEPTLSNRQAWLNELSYRQYNIDELSSGFCWEILGHHILGKAPKLNAALPHLYPNNFGMSHYDSLEA